MYYVRTPEGNFLFGHYHKPILEVKPEDKENIPQQRMPPGCEEYLKADTVLKINLSKGPDAPISSISFNEFAAFMHKTLGTVPPPPREVRKNRKECDIPANELALLRPHAYVPGQKFSWSNKAAYLSPEEREKMRFFVPNNKIPSYLP
jgi:hypothetical protein